MSDRVESKRSPLLRFLKILYGIFTVIMVIWAILYVPAVLNTNATDHDFGFILMTTNEYLVAGVIWGAIAIASWIYRYVKGVPPEQPL